MPNLHELEAAIPVAPLKLVVMDSAVNLGENVNNHLVGFRKSVKNIAKNNPAFEGYLSDNYILDSTCYRFGSGEGKALLSESIRGKDLFILTDVCNHSISYKINGYTNYKSPDDHYQDLKRVIAAANGKAHRVNVIIPFLYEGRQHKRNGHESLDCAQAIEELSKMGISNLITFDAHDPSIQNAAPLCGFDNFTPPYQFISALLGADDSLLIDREHLVVVSPNENAIDRAVYFANVLEVNTGTFYNRFASHSASTTHEFLGDNVDGKDAIIINDIITTGKSMIEKARRLKEMNAKRVFIFCTFGLFTEGLARFDEAYEQCCFDRIITTNLTYRIPELKSRPYYIEADMSKFLASIIDFMNHDSSMANVYTPTDKIHRILNRYNNREDDFAINE
ncbi:MAG: ribose-phosphate pyrophosphokinase [Lachnospiraceae bacterium]|jgi:ribose-phosphate pyrophosphokinase|nr:ribose-phosphate pyrophosphokinase [Lachnospiraceae bacterium]MCI9326556.1 ribose-phosphate pyrophosphokinase [Lachnospiraceae bacterium]